MDNFLSVERVNIVTRTTVEGVLYGFTFALYIICARSLYLGLGDQYRRKQCIFTLSHMTLVMACGLLGLSIDTRDIQASYIDHADFPDHGGFGYSVIVFGRSPLAVLGYAIGILLDLLTYGVQIWRLWIIWRMSRYSVFIVIMPSLSLFAYTGIMIINFVHIARPDLLRGSINISVVYGSKALVLFVAIFVTLMIISKIAVVRREHVKLLGHSGISGQYTSTIAMLVESFALESLWVTLSIILNICFDNDTGGAAGVFFATTGPSIQILAYLLVVYRVTTGRGWNKDTERHLTSLQFNNMDALQNTQLGAQTSILRSRGEV
ncbi:hypothetical protein D9756_006749 [Leucocoprinus leucothites]|uniref:Uncharacterized protein n=1 Tax=Leucocoprinus leucothites TaxID=201217 RepID=A0A8H5G1U8_9AGAR|nr:hypothetical protein D9756_006749 [Leucoagaricus leucothites]